MANDIFRVGKVSSIDYAAGLVRVAYHDKDDSVTAPLPMLCTEYNMPQVGDPVMVLHLSNGTEAGLCWAGIGQTTTSPRRARRACSARIWTGRRGEA